MDSTESYIPPPPSIEPRPITPTEPPPVPKAPPAFTKEVTPIERHFLENQVPEINLSSWGAIAMEAMRYPFRQDGLFILIPGAILGVILGAFGHLMLVGTLALGAFGWFAAYYMSVVESTISGKDAPPSWPGFENLRESLMVPALQLSGAALIPVVLFLIIGTHVEKDSTANLVVMVIGEVVRDIYFPMSILGIAIHGAFVFTLPHHVIPAICRALPDYAYVVIAMFVLSILQGICVVIAGLIPLAGIWLKALVIFYSYICQARFIGIAYRRLQERIGW